MVYRAAAPRHLSQALGSRSRSASTAGINVEASTIHRATRSAEGVAVVTSNDRAPIVYSHRFAPNGQNGWSTSTQSPPNGLPSRARTRFAGGGAAGSTSVLWWVSGRARLGSD